MHSYTHCTGFCNREVCCFVIVPCSSIWEHSEVKLYLMLLLKAPSLGSTLR